MTRRIVALVMLLCCGVSPAALAQQTVDNEITSARLLLESEQIVAGQPLWVGIELTPQDHWHTYWQNAGDSGMASSISWTAPDGFGQGPIHWLPPQRIEYSGLYNYGYEGATALLVPLDIPTKLEPGKSYDISAKANWLVCKDICIPESASFTFTVTAADSMQPTAEYDTLHAYLEQIPGLHLGKASYEASDSEVRLKVQLPADLPELTKAWWFPIQDGVLTNDSEQRWLLEDGHLILTAARGSQPTPDAFDGLLALTTADGDTQHLITRADFSGTAPTAAQPQTTPSGTATPPATPDSTGGTGLLAAILSALLGGIILNIMPCVLPILSLKALSVAKHAHHNPAGVRLQGIAYTLGILLTFSIIAGLLIVLQQAGQSIGWGFQLQSPAFVVALVYLLFVVGLNLSGLFELPNLLGGMSARAHNPYTESFFTGMLATLLATPCTAPFMAAALGYAISQPPLIALTVFLSLGLGLALPYLLICFAPPLRRLLPKPGIWMQHFKEFMAFPIYASVAWLLWVLVQQSGADGLAFALLGLILIGFAIWLLPLLKTVIMRTALFLLIIAGIIWSVKEQTPQPAAALAARTSVLQADVFSQAKLDALRAEGKPVFVYATAAWCITCKVNERAALASDSVAAHFAQHNIQTLRADWTNFDDEITRYLKDFGRSGVPIYVYYPLQGEPQLLPQLLTPQTVIDNTQL